MYKLFIGRAVVAVLATSFCSYLLVSYLRSDGQMRDWRPNFESVRNSRLLSRTSLTIEPLDNTNIAESHWYAATCGTPPRQIEELADFLTQLTRAYHEECLNAARLFNSVYNVRLKSAPVIVRGAFKEKVLKWMKGDASLAARVETQVLVHVDNKYTLDSNVFNPLRNNRPQPAGSLKQTLHYINQLVNTTREGCDFCSPDGNTADDSLGIRTSRLGNRIVPNTFKWARYSGLLIFPHHHPLDISQAEWIDAVQLSMDWFQSTHKETPDEDFWHIYWELFPRSAASQVHPHMHLLVTDYSYDVVWNQLFQATHTYAQENQGANYWTELIRIHTVLGLSTRLGDATLIAHLTPRKEYELMVIARLPSKDFFKLVYLATNGLKLHLKQFACSLSIVFPTLHAAPHKNGNELPTIMRTVSRGPANSRTSDTGSNDFFGTPQNNVDPFLFISKLKQYIIRERLKG